MTLTVTHSFVSGVADDPTAAAAGEVLPSHWNAQHVVTGVALQQATGNISLFVATTGSDSNPGTALLPFATIQHAIAVALSYDYQSLYVAQIKLANGNYSENLNISSGIFQGMRTGSVSASASIIGNTASPANVKIKPLTGSDASVITISGGFWLLDGVSIVADPAHTTGGSLFAAGYSLLLLGDIIIDGGTGSIYSRYLSSQQYSKIVGGQGTNQTLTIQGDGAHCSTIFDCNVESVLEPDAFIIFASIIVLTGGSVFNTSNHCTLDISNSSFTTPGNVTGGYPLNVLNQSSVSLGQDPTLVTWPGGAFVVTFSGNIVIDATSSIDEFIYTIPNAGSLVDQSTIYRGSWQIHKDTNQSTATRGLALWADDAGSLFPLTPPVTTFANLPGTPLVGMRAAITDGLAGNCADGTCTTWGTNVTGGGGALNLLIWYNGAHWTLTGK